MVGLRRFSSCDISSSKIVHELELRARMLTLNCDVKSDDCTHGN